MVTGVEAAGLALAVFPLVIEGMKTYASGARSIKDMMEYEGILKQYSREIKMEKVQFENTCYQLLEDMLSTEESTFHELMSDPKHAKWREEELHSALSNRLRTTESVALFEDAVEELSSILNELAATFNPGRTMGGKQPDKRTMKKFLKMFDVVFEKETRDKKLERIRQLNKDLRYLVSGAEPENTMSTVIPRGTNPASRYKRVRTYAIAVYHVIKEKFQDTRCLCQVPHTASLQLEVRNLRSVAVKGSLGFRFQLLFSSSTLSSPECRQLAIECLDHCLRDKSQKIGDDPSPRITSTPIASSPVPAVVNVANNSGIGNEGLMASIKSRMSLSKMKTKFLSPTGPVASSSRPVSPSQLAARRTPSPASAAGPRRVAFQLPEPARHTDDSVEVIACLCSTIQSVVPGCNAKPCLGMIISSEDDHTRHKLWLPERQWLNFQPEQYVTLDGIFSGPGVKPSKRSILKLGVKLASSLMQLHESKWLSENWGRKDIFFLQDSTGPLIEKPLLHQIFLPSDIPEAATPNSQQITSWPKITCINRSLYSLGVMLIEIWYWKSLETLEQEAGNPQIGSDEVKEWVAAQSYVNLLLEDAGAPYGTAVKRCILGFGHMNMELDREDFKNEVYKQIVCPLEENLRNFCGERDLEKICSY